MNPKDLGLTETKRVATMPRCKAGLNEHNYIRLLCASDALKPYLEAELNAHEPWSSEIDEFLSALDALQV